MCISGSLSPPPLPSPPPPPPPPTPFITFNYLLLVLLFSRRQEELEVRLVEDETTKRVEELVAKRVQEELERRKDEIEAEVLRRVEEAKRLMEHQMLQELERKQKAQEEEEKKKKVVCCTVTTLYFGYIVDLLNWLLILAIQYHSSSNYLHLFICKVSGPQSVFRTGLWEK